MPDLDGLSLEAMAEALVASNQYRVLRRLQPRSAYRAGDGSRLRRGLIVDVETTGLDPARHHIIQLAALPFEYCPRTGRVFSAGEALCYFEDPGYPIPRAVTELTRIRTADVAGCRIDDEAVAAILASTAIVIAHNAGFDRKFVERRLPAFRERPWACSMAEVPWDREGHSTARLEILLYKHCGLFSDGHRADVDCHATLEVLAAALPSGRTPLDYLLQSARRRTVRLWATNAPIETKDLLKARSYRWNGGSAEQPRAWYRDLPEEEAAGECAWLSAQVYAGGEGWRRETFDALSRYRDGY